MSNFASIVLMIFANNGITNLPAPAEKAVPQPSAKVIESWSKKGANYRFVQCNEWLELSYTKEMPEGSFIPGFACSRETLDGIKGLEKPNAPFGLLLYELELDAEQLATICRYDNLKFLDLEGTNLTDDQLKAIASVKSLEFLCLNRTKVTDVGMQHLAKHPSLRMIDLRRNVFTGEGLKSLASIKTLESVAIEGHKFKGEYVDELMNCNALRTLNLTNTKLTDGDLKAVGRLTSLERLNLWSSRGLTDFGLRHLAPLKKLEVLILIGTGCTDEGGNWLKRKIPALQFDVESKKKCSFAFFSG